MNIKQTGLSLMAALTVAWAVPAQTLALSSGQTYPYQTAQETTTIEREREILPEMTPREVEIERHEGLVTHETKIENGIVDENDTEYAGFSLMTWVVLGLVVLAIVAFMMSRRNREYPQI